jgi:hypothetical protein
MKSNKSNYYLAGAVSVITFLVYLSSLQNEFVHLDDPVYVFENPHITSLDISFFKWAFFDFYASNWHPLTWLSHALDYAIWGLNPVGHHLTNITLHSINTFIVVLLTARLVEISQEKVSTAETPISLDAKRIMTVGGATGLLFGLHPIHVESAAWVSERKDLLCALFFLLSITVYTRYVIPVNKETGPKQVKSSFLNKHYLLSLCFFALALFSKPMAVSLPVVLMILDWYPFNRIRSVKTFCSVFTEKIPLFSLSVVSSILTILAQKSGGAVITLEFIPFSTRLLVAPKALITYLWNIIFPWNLSPFYPYPLNPSFFSLEYLFPIVVIIGFTMFAIAIAKKERLWLAAYLYYIFTLLPVIGIVQVGFQAMADRYTYLPSLGIFLIFGLALHRVEKNVYDVIKGAILRRVFAIVAALSLLGSITYLTVNQITIWKSDFSLWNHIIEKTPEGVGVYYAYKSRGSIYNQMGQLDKAIDDYSKAIALNQGDTQTIVYRGLAYLKLGQVQLAIADFNRACELGDIFGCNAPRYLK